ncbi:MAG: histidine phosphatase family protein [Myxococcota bacterium]
MQGLFFLTAVRHPPVVAEGLCFGQSDVPVSVAPEECVDRVHQSLSGRACAVIWTSPLSRCAQLANCLSARVGAPVCVDERILEMSFGVWEGQAWDELTHSDGVRLSQWMNDWERQRPPQGESTEDLVERVQDWWNSLDRSAHQLLVAHAGVVRALRVIQGSSWNEAMEQKVPHLSAEEFPLR